MAECRRIEQRKADEVRRLELARKEEELLAREGALEEAHFHAAEMRAGKDRWSHRPEMFDGTVATEVMAATTSMSESIAAAISLPQPPARSSPLAQSKSSAVASRAGLTKYAQGNVLPNNDRAHAVATMRAEDRNVGSVNGARQLQHPPFCVTSHFSTLGLLGNHFMSRVPCRAGTCTTPIQITSSQLVSNEIFPPSVVKAMLYPGAIVRNLTTSMSMTFPRWSDLFDIYNLTEAKNASAVIDLQRLEMLAGSYFCVAGALVGIINPGRMILFGTLLVIWGLVKDVLFRKPVTSDPTEPVYVYPTILIALICSFMSITYNVKKKAMSSHSVSISKPLQSSAKSKLK
ncbi:hypothetical protein ACQJBY_027076 [Aegilops geniculata]